MDQMRNFSANKELAHSHYDELRSALNRMSVDQLQRLHFHLNERLQRIRSPSAIEHSDGDISIAAKLTLRENDVLTLLASGYRRREIGEVLDISENTAATHIASIYRKLGIKSIAEATHLAIRSGIVALT